MKKLLAILLAAVMLFSVTGCEMLNKYKVGEWYAFSNVLTKDVAKIECYLVGETEIAENPSRREIASLESSKSFTGKDSDMQIIMYEFDSLSDIERTAMFSAYLCLLEGQVKQIPGYVLQRGYDDTNKVNTVSIQYVDEKKTVILDFNISSKESAAIVTVIESSNEE